MYKNGYVLIIGLAFVVTIMSFFVEMIYPFLKKIDNVWFVFGVFIFRFFHFLAFVYFSFFIFLVSKRKSVDVIIYLIFVLLMELSWKIYEYCPFTYYELKMYGVDETEYNTTFHPSLYALFRHYSDYIIYFTGIAMIINVGYILYKEKWISPSLRIFYGAIFTYLIVSTTFEHRYGDFIL